MTEHARAWLRGPLASGGMPAAATGTVMKLGGSLLSLPDWPRRCGSLLRSVPRPLLLVVGGGAVVDGLRAIDAAGGLHADTAHWLAIDALGITARVVAAALGIPFTAAPGGADTLVLDTPAWLRDQGNAARLPSGWHVTSDSIAARVAVMLGRRLLLVKRVPPPPHTDLATLAAAGWVDAYFTKAAEGLGDIDWAAPPP